MPDVGEKQGPKGDGKQDKGEGDAPCEAKLGGVKFGGLGEGGRNQRKQGRDDLDGFHGFPVWLCCDTHGLFAREAGRVADFRVIRLCRFMKNLTRQTGVEQGFTAWGKRRK